MLASDDRRRRLPPRAGADGDRGDARAPPPGALHRDALAALVAPPAGAPDPARLAHHAEAAGDADAVLEFAPAAAARADAVGAHRQAAAQYARALRFAADLPLEKRVALLEGRFRSAFRADDCDEAIEAMHEALAGHRTLGDRRREGDGMRRLSDILFCPGDRCAEAERLGRDAGDRARGARAAAASSGWPTRTWPACA